MSSRIASSPIRPGDDESEFQKTVQKHVDAWFKDVQKLHLDIADLCKQIDACEDDSAYQDFYHLEGGMKLLVKVKSEKYAVGGRSGSFNPFIVTPPPREAANISRVAGS